MGEKLNSAQKHDLTEGFKQMEASLEVRKDGNEAILQACISLANNLGID